MNKYHVTDSLLREDVNRVKKIDASSALDAARIYLRITDGHTGNGLFSDIYAWPIWRYDKVKKFKVKKLFFGLFRYCVNSKRSSGNELYNY